MDIQTIHYDPTDREQIPVILELIGLGYDIVAALPVVNALPDEESGDISLVTEQLIVLRRGRPAQHTGHEALGMLAVGALGMIVIAVMLALWA